MSDPNDIVVDAKVLKEIMGEAIQRAWSYQCASGQFPDALQVCFDAMPGTCAAQFDLDSDLIQVKADFRGSLFADKVAEQILRLARKRGS